MNDAKTTLSGLFMLLTFVAAFWLAGLGMWYVKMAASMADLVQIPCSNLQEGVRADCREINLILRVLHQRIAQETP